MSKLTIQKMNDKLVTDSRDVADLTGFRHDNLLSKIRGYIDILDSSKLRSRDFFVSNSYLNEQNKEQPNYLLTKKGCDMVANKMTGEKGVLFTAMYVTQFEDMENELRYKKPAEITSKSSSYGEIASMLKLVSEPWKSSHVSPRVRNKMTADFLAQYGIKVPLIDDYVMRVNEVPVTISEITTQKTKNFRERLDAAISDKK